jgi:hypothetical protein
VPHKGLVVTDGYELSEGHTVQSCTSITGMRHTTSCMLYSTGTGTLEMSGGVAHRINWW